MQSEKVELEPNELDTNELFGHLKSQLELCDRLERFADSLPDNFDSQECLSISWSLYPTVKEAHQFEEQKLFPLLVPQNDNDTEIAKSIERLRFEHWEDESFAEEISTALKQLVSDPAATNIDKLSYMLRGFFEGLRRHIAFEAEHIVPMLDHHLPQH